MTEKKQVIAIIQARMGSARLKGKVMMTIEGNPMLWHVVDRLKYCSLIDRIVVATSDGKADDDVEKFCEKYRVNFFRGSENDVLGRYYNAAKKYDAWAVVRITADCPLIDPKVTDKTIRAYLDNQKDCDGASNVIKRSYPRGLDTEVISFECLERCHRQTGKEYEREHVTVYFYEHPEFFRIYSVENNKDLSYMRWTVDEKKDLDFVKKIYTKLYQNGKIFFMEDILDLLDKEPELIEINKNIKQKIIT